VPRDAPLRSLRGENRLALEGQREVLVSMDDVTPRSRRAILGAALGGLAASVAAAVGRPATAEAADGGAVLLGLPNAATNSTDINASGSLAMTIISTGQTVQAQGVGSGVQAVATGLNGLALAGYSNSATGTGKGVLGTSIAVDGVGVAGISSASSTGVIGVSIPQGGSVPPNLDRTGVYGYAAQDATSRGVFGYSPAGLGVFGQASTGQGVHGDATTGIGVYAGADSDGTALFVNGRSVFSRAGRATVAANQTSVDVTIPGGLVPSTFIIATLQTNRTGVWVTHARNNFPVNGKARIYLNTVASTTEGTTIGWIAIG